MNQRGGSRPTPFIVILLGAIFVVANVPGCSELFSKIGGIGVDPVATTTPTVAMDDAERAEARDLIAGLLIGQPGSTRPYDRDAFGPRWADVDRNGCDTRNDILQRDLDDVTFRSGTKKCVVIAGVLDDPYTGERVQFTKAKASAVQIDHVFPLAAAWRLGAADWNEMERTRFANDPINLVAVDGSANMSKGAKLPSEWMPPNKANECWYAAQIAQVAVEYDLAVPPIDKMHMVSACSD